MRVEELGEERGCGECFRVDVEGVNCVLLRVGCVFCVIKPSCVYVVALGVISVMLCVSVMWCVCVCV